jgi:hypothetical protein
LLDVDPDEIDPLTGKARVCGVWTAGLKRSVVEGRDVIRLLEFFPYIVVSRRFVDLFNSSGFTVATFSCVPVN